MLNFSATCSPWVHAGHREAVAVLTTGCLLNIDQLHRRRPCVRQDVCWPHIELDSGVSPTDEIDWFSAPHDWTTCFAESHNSWLFHQCVKLQVLGIACSYRVASLCFSRCGPLTSISRAVEQGIFRSTTGSWSFLEASATRQATQQTAWGDTGYHLFVISATCLVFAVSALS